MTDTTGPEDRADVIERHAKRDTPALPEPVAFAYVIDGKVHALSRKQSEQCPHGLVPAAQLQEALDRADRAETKLRNIFASDGDEEARWIEEVKHACPHCGGSGHKDDVRATSAEAALDSARKVIERLTEAADCMGDRNNDGMADNEINAARQWLSANPAKETT